MPWKKKAFDPVEVPGQTFPTLAAYPSDIVLGQRYRMKRHDIEGVVVAVTFFENACERASLEYLHDGEVIQVGCDAVELVSVETGKQAETSKPGGPDRGAAVRTAVGRR